MQVTNYGLGGLCEPHIGKNHKLMYCFFWNFYICLFSDPIGLLEVKKTGPQYKNLPYTGDMLGTFMAWLSDTEAGGDTIYCQPGIKKCFKINLQSLWNFAIVNFPWC